VLRGLAYAMAAAFFVSTIFQLADQLNLIYQPPAVPDSANLVERVTATIPYVQQVWPIFFLANALLGLGFLLLVGLAIALAGRAARSDDRRHLLLWTLATAGIVGGIAQVALVGAVKARIEIPYCDCGFKDQEIVSQVWAEMVVQSASQVLVYAAALFAAGGLVTAAAIFRSVMPAGWQLLSWLGAALLVLAVILGWANLGGDAANWLTAAISGLVIPAWAIWLGRRFPHWGEGDVQAAAA
jgi:hypothetical protein